MIKAVTFDLDDTLWDVRPALVQAEEAQNRWLNAHFPAALADMDHDALLARKRQLIKDQPELIHNISLFRKLFIKHLLLRAGESLENAQAGAEAAFAEFIARRHHVALFEHAEPVLEKLANRYTLGALTNGNADVFKTPLAPYFQFALKAEDVGAAKPDAAMFELAMKLAEVNADELVHVGDSHDHDIIGAHRLGIASVWLAPNDEDGALPQSQHASAVIGCLSDLPMVLDELDA